MGEFIYAGKCKRCGQFKTAYDVYHVIDEKWGMAGLNKNGICRECA